MREMILAIFVLLPFVMGILAAEVAHLAIKLSKRRARKA